MEGIRSGGDMGEYDPGHIHDVLIVGAGFGGIGMAVCLLRAGVTDFLMRGRRLGRDDAGAGAGAGPAPARTRAAAAFEPGPVVAAG